MGVTLGKNQRAVLESMAAPDHSDTWYPGCGWIWGNRSETERIMVALERRGLLDRVPVTDRVTGWRINTTGKAEAAR
ncbi:hypothetical protein [Kitasatospora sp. NPDC088779]|uniref:hypothetical protein n=1 Tax=unclassified Kitasatospora TaxID=2633591 RepID=UPI003433BB68